MSRAERIARLKRSLSELKSRVGRIENESFCAVRQIAEIEAELLQLAEDSE